MKKMMAAYWHKDGLDIYSYAGEKPVRFASGTLESLQPINRGFGRRVLIVGRERLMHLRKRYPPAPKDKLAKAVGLEIEEIFPLSRPNFYCRIFRSISNYVELDIWAWETDFYERLEELFPFSYVIPEDVLFAADETEIMIFQYGDFVHMLAHAKDRFLDSVTIPLAGFDDGQFSRFLFNLSQVGEEIKRIIIYGLPQFHLKGGPGPELVRVEEMLYPACMEGMAQMDLREFKVKSEYLFIPPPQPALVMRICLYLVLGYGLMLFLTMKNYDQVSTETRQRIAAMDKKAIALAASQPTFDYSDVVQEVNARLQKSHVPLKIINMLAQKLPEGSFINRIMLTDNNLELLTVSKDPLTVVNALSGGENVKKVMIKGMPSRDRGTGLYTFVAILELTK